MRQPANDNTLQRERAAPASTVRLKPVVRLSDGAFAGALVESRVPFGAQVSFGPVVTQNSGDSPSKWLASQIDALPQAMTRLPAPAAPMILPAPLPALAHSNTALACSAAVHRSSLIHQEIVIEFADAACTGDALDTIARLSSLRRLGFRLGLDFRQAWTTPLSEPIRVLIDTLRVDARQIGTDARLDAAIEAAHAAQILVIAENARWRDGEQLADCGVTAAIQPRYDA